MSVLLFCCFLFSFLSVSSGMGESQGAFTPYPHGTSFSRLNSLLRLFSRMNQLAGSPHPSAYGHPERGLPYYYPSPMMPEYPMDYYPPVYPPADDVFYQNYPPLFDQRYGGYPEDPYGYGGMFGYNEDPFIADYPMSHSQPIFDQKPFPKKFAVVYIPVPLRGPFNPHGLEGNSLPETARPIGSPIKIKDAHSATGVSVETNVKGLAADAVASSGPAVPPKLPAAPVTVRS